MRPVELNLQESMGKIITLLNTISQQEIVSESDDVPMALNIIKMLEMYASGNFYGTVAIKMVGVKSRNIKVIEQTFKLCEEKEDLIIK